MKVALIGTHDSGKTTTFNLLKPHLPNFHFIPELIQNYNFRTTSYYEYMHIQEKVLAKQLGHELLHSNTISDRSTLDNLAYMILAYYKHNTPPYNLSQITSIPIVKQAIKNFKTYDYLFLCDIMTSVEDDIEYQETINNIILYLLKKYQLSYFILTGLPDIRIQKILEEIRYK